MHIRKAKTGDAEHIAKLLLLAMEEIVYAFIGEKDHQKALDFLLYFAAKEDNQYSFQNCWVIEDTELVAVVNIYDGADLHQLRQPIEDYIQQQHGKHFKPEDETQAGEFYIDSFAVSPNQRGKGIGSKMLRFLINEHVMKNEQSIGLLVEHSNPNAKKLYLKLGFQDVGEKILAGKKLHHMQVNAARIKRDSVRTLMGFNI